MSVELAASRPIVALRWPGLVVARLTARKAVRSAAVWGAVFGLYVATSAFGYASTYKTAAERAKLVATFGSNPGFNALIGPAHQIGTVPGFTAWRCLGVLSIVGAVWGLLAGTRLTRGEEESGRWEVLLAGATTRRRAAAQALAGMGTAVLALWAVTAVVTVGVGRSQKVGIGLGGALFFSLALVASPAIFLALGALTGQLAATRRQAAGYAAAVLGVAYALRMISDSGTGVGWLRWLSPLGWVEELRPITAPRPLVLVPIAALIAMLVALSVHLAGIRDLDTSTFPDRPTSRPHTGLLAGTTGLAARLSRGVVIGWSVSLAASALMMGLVAKSVGNGLAADAGDREAFAKLGFRGSGVGQYLAITFLLIALLLAFAAAGQINAARGEEAAGRLDQLLVRPLSRYRWLGGRLAVAIGFLVSASLVAGVAAWMGAASQHSGVAFGTLLAAGVNAVPPAIVVLGVGVLTFGIWPRAVPTVTYGLLAWAFLIEIVGTIVDASHWLLDTSVFHQMTAAPAVAPNWTADLTMLVVGAAATLVGGLAFRWRDLAGE